MNRSSYYTLSISLMAIWHLSMPLAAQDKPLRQAQGKPLRQAQDGPNVVIILADDLGIGVKSHSNLAIAG